MNRQKPKYNYIAKGSFGCLVQPAAPCSNKEHPVKTAGKLFTSKYNMKMALEANDELELIDPRNMFTVKALESCEIDPIEYGSTLKKCNPATLNLSKIPQVIYPFYPMTIEKASKIIPFEKLFIGLENCFRGLLEVDQKGFLHSDIKTDNMMYDPQQQKSVLIDFDLLMPKKDLYTGKYASIFSVDRIWYPPEYGFVARIVFLKEWQDIAEKRVKAFVSSNVKKVSRIEKSTLKYYVTLLDQMNVIHDANKINIALQNVVGLPPNPAIDFRYTPNSTHVEFIDLVKDLMRKFNNVEHKRILLSMIPDDIHEQMSEFVKRNAPIKIKLALFAGGFDVYSLGIALLDTLISSFDNHLIHIASRAAFYSDVLTLIKNMVTVVPDKRFTMEQAYDEFLMIKAGTKSSRKSLTRKNASVIRK